MKKSFYFALALTAGLFASCSSDELTSQAPAGLDVNDNEAAAIQIGVAQPGMTRGTGTVGSTKATDNKWAGQNFNLFMFKKGTFETAKKTVTNPTTNQDEEVDIYNNAVMTTPDDGTSAATYVIDNVLQYNYYPTTGAYSFWAYRIDDAGTGTAGVGVPVGVNDATATEVKVPFIIDGSQDIMTAVPDEAADLATLQHEVSTATADKIYTAYSARRNVTPKLSFKHQLTRLTFQVKANSSEVSDAAVLPAGAPAGTYAGFKVTGISVRSKAKGNIIAARKDGSTYSDQAVVFDDPNEDWATLNTLTPMELKSRGEGVTQKQDGKFTENKIEVAIAADGTPTYNVGYMLNGTQMYTAAATVVYDANTVNAYTGVPNGKQSTLGELVAAYVAQNPNTAGTVDGYAYAKTQNLVTTGQINAAANLIDLEEVIPHWDATYTWTAYTPQATAYNWEEVAAAPVGGNDVSASVTAVPTTTTVGAVGDYTLISAKYYELKSISYDSDGCRELAAAPDNSDLTADPVVLGTIGQDGEIVKITGTTNYYKCAVAGNNTGAKTNVGEALLVAPLAPSYEMTLTYKRWKPVSATSFSEIEGIVTKTIALSTAGAAFEAGKSYNVVVTLYKDGEASTDTNLNPWTPGEEIEIDGEDE